MQCVVLSMLVVLLSADSASPVIRFESDPTVEGFGTVSVVGLSRQQVATLGDAVDESFEWTRLFAVHTIAGRDEGRPAILGDYSIVADSIRFRPRFPFVELATYVATFDGELLSIEFTMPESIERQATRVVAIYPSSVEVPENLLKLYIHFSAPMNPKNVASHLHLYDDSGHEVTMPFVEVRHGLWDLRNQRLTLFFHPGRLKRGVAPNRLLGPPLREGETYRFALDPALRDALGFPLVEPYERTIRVGPVDRRVPVIDDWTVVAPSRRDAPLRIDLPEPYERALMQRMIVVEDAAGNPIDGVVAITRGETRWEFTPEMPWRPGSYSIRIDRGLEDLAGNTFDRLFEESTPGREVPDTPITIRFEVS